MHNILVIKSRYMAALALFGRQLVLLLLLFRLCATSGAEDVEVGSLAVSPSKGFRVLGAAADYYSGKSVGTAGDINGDGVSDVFIGAYGVGSASGWNEQTVYIIFGRNRAEVEVNPFNDIQLTWATPLNADVGFRIMGSSASDISDRTVSAAGDINGDGIGDLILAAPDAGAGGTVYVLFGRNQSTLSVTPFGDVDLPSLTTSAATGFRILGVSGSQFGASASAAGDVNGDGIADIIASAPYANPPGIFVAGITYVIFGRNVAGGAAAFQNIQLTTSALSASVGFRIFGAATGDLIGFTIGAAGDVNGDGIDDVMVGAPFINAGISYVVFGRDIAGGSTPFGDIQLTTTTMPTSIGFRILGAAAGDKSGCSLRAVGDMNNDGFGDIIIGALYGDPPSGDQAGISYVIFGRNLTRLDAVPFGDVQLTTGGVPLSASVGFRILGAVQNDQSGFSVSAAGDVNGDGISDCIVGAIIAQNLETISTGAAYVIFGRNIAGGAAPFGDIQLTSGVVAMPGDIGFRILGGIASDYMGYSVGVAGDMNDDGVSDVIVGAPQADILGGADAGHSYVVFGAYPAPTSQPSSQPSRQPSGQPTSMPSQPSSQPSMQPSGQPSNQPTSQPSRQPIGRPSAQPSAKPSSQPSRQPSVQPSAQPSHQPTSTPSVQPSQQPSTQPTAQPSTQPSSQPSRQPTSQPSAQPSVQPSAQPSHQPTSRPSVQPSMQPSTQPSTQPSIQPNCNPSGQPMRQPSRRPSAQPSAQPSDQPKSCPSAQPSNMPSSQPTIQPTVLPSMQPMSVPTAQPSCQPTHQPSSRPTTQPTNAPSAFPSGQPSQQPSSQPSMQPSLQPTGGPSAQPTSQPSEQPSSQPSAQPSYLPSMQPSTQPSNHPSLQPSGAPSAQPSHQPSIQPSALPSRQPSAQPSSQPTVSPSAHPTQEFFTGEWAALLEGHWAATHVAPVSDTIWACGKNSVDDTNTRAFYSNLDARYGSQKARFSFPWTELTSTLQATDPSKVHVAGLSVSNSAVSSEVGVCVIGDTHLTCIAQSFADTALAAGSYVSFADKLLYTGTTKSTFCTVSILNRVTNAAQNYVYSTTTLQSISLLHVLSPPNFIGGFVAGTCVSTSSFNYIFAGMVRTDSGSMIAMYVSPTSNTIVNSAELVNAMALEPVGPDSFIAGGLQLSDGRGMQAYLLRVNALYYKVMYGVRYIVPGGSNVNRRMLQGGFTVTSVVKGMVLFENSLYMIINAKQTWPAEVKYGVTVLKTNAATGSIVQQVHIYSSSASIQCTDIASVGLFFAISCALQYGTNTTEGVVLSVNRELTFSALPAGFVRYESDVFVSEPVSFQRTVLSLTVQSDARSTNDYTFSTADGNPTIHPTTIPTLKPSAQPSNVPSGEPSSSPTAAPSVSPQPTSQPSSSGPTNTYKPTVKPTQQPTERPTMSPSLRPTRTPSNIPSVNPSVSPSISPSIKPSTSPSSTAPTHGPSIRPTRHPTVRGTNRPTSKPSVVPTAASSGSNDRRKYRERESLILGQSVAGVFGLWCLYHFCQWWWFKVKEVRKDTKRMGQMRAQNLPAKPRYPIFSAVAGLCFRFEIPEVPESEHVSTSQPAASSTQVTDNAAVAITTSASSHSFGTHGAFINGPANDEVDLEANLSPHDSRNNNNGDVDHNDSSGQYSNSASNSVVSRRGKKRKRWEISPKQHVNVVADEPERVHPHEEACEQIHGNVLKSESNQGADNNNVSSILEEIVEERSDVSSSQSEEEIDLSEESTHSYKRLNTPVMSVRPAEYDIPSDSSSVIYTISSSEETESLKSVDDSSSSASDSSTGDGDSSDGDSSDDEGHAAISLPIRCMHA